MTVFFCKGRFKSKMNEKCLITLCPAEASACGQNFQRRRVVSMRDPKRDQSVRVIVVRVALLLVPVCIYNNDILIICVVW